jgi:hypothetical protein
MSGPKKSRKLRALKLGPVVYFWRVRHCHNVGGPAGAFRCDEVFTAFHEKYPRSPVRIRFPDTEEHGPGFPGHLGGVVDYRDPTLYVNLNQPRVARLLIELAIASGWNPSQSRSEFLLADGYELLRQNRARVDAALASDADGAR